MRQQANRRIWIRAAILVLFLVGLSIPALSQSCALCYTQAASAGQRMIQALRSGILILIFPPMGICIGLIVASYKKRHLFGERSNSLRRSDNKSDLGW